MAALSDRAPEVALAFRREQAVGTRLAFLVRAVALGVIAAWVVARAGIAGGLPYLIVLGVFFALGLVQWLAAGREHVAFRMVQGALVLADMALLAWALTTVPGGPSTEWPAAMQLRLGNFDYFYVFIGFAVLSYAPWLPLWTGIAAALAWSVAVLAVLQTGRSFTVLDLASLHGLSPAQLKALLLDADYVSAVIWMQELLLALIVASVLALAVRRSRRLALEEARVAAERTNLARYFSPNLVERLAHAGRAVEEVRAQEVGILFVDIVGFTPLAERMAPGEVIGLLREFHAKLAGAVFTHGGTVNKYLGDAVMATFGTPVPGSEDARNAIACCFTMLRVMEAWNETRRQAGAEIVRIGIGVHYGPVVQGNIGDERCLEFAVLGDAVNIASRLEALTRELAVDAVISEATVARAVEEVPDGTGWLTALQPRPPCSLRGRAAPVAIRVVGGPRGLTQGLGAA